MLRSKITQRRTNLPISNKFYSQWGRAHVVSINCRRTVKEQSKTTSSKTTANKTTKGRSVSPKPDASKRIQPQTSRKTGTQQRKEKSAPNPIQELVIRISNDGTLLMGDLVMIAATEVSSERIPYESLPMLAGVSIGSWVVASAILGDYKQFPPTTDNWYLSLLGPVFLAIVDSTLTWAIAVVLSLAIFSVLVSTNHMDSAPLLEDLSSENLSPQLEVAVALLITMSCWRGIAARLRS